MSTCKYCINPEAYPGATTCEVCMEGEAGEMTESELAQEQRDTEQFLADRGPYGSNV